MDIDRAYNIVRENVALMAKKNADYSSDNLVHGGELGVAIRLLDKVFRQFNLLSSGKTPNYESIADTWDDIANYGLIGRLISEGSWIPSTTYVYLAGPINGIEQDQAHYWRYSVSKALGEAGIGTFSPVGAHSVGRMEWNAKKVADIDRYAIDTCDVVIANLLGDGLSFGTIREIEYARSHNKRVIVVRPDLKSAFAHDVEIVGTLAEAITRLTGRECPSL